MNCNRFGFFDDLSPTKKVELLKLLCSEKPHSRKSEILAYLRSGVPVFAVSRITRDPLGGNSVIGRPDIFTDGDWFWSSDVCYYIEKYNIEIPNDFLTHMENRGWRVGEVQLLEAIRKCDWLNESV